MTRSDLAEDFLERRWTTDGKPVQVACQNVMGVRLAKLSAAFQHLRQPKVRFGETRLPIDQGAIGCDGSFWVSRLQGPGGLEIPDESPSVRFARPRAETRPDRRITRFVARGNHRHRQCPDSVAIRGEIIEQAAEVRDDSRVFIRATDGDVQEGPRDLPRRPDRAQLPLFRLVEQPEGGGTTRQPA